MKCRYTKPGKAEAYKTAVRLAAELPDDLNHPQISDVVSERVAALHPDLHHTDVAQVAVKALRVARYNRFYAETDEPMTQINVRLSTSDLQRLDALAVKHGSQSQAVRLAIRQAHEAL